MSWYEKDHQNIKKLDTDEHTVPIGGEILLFTWYFSWIVCLFIQVQLLIKGKPYTLWKNVFHVQVQLMTIVAAGDKYGGFLYFHTNYEIICFSSVKNTIGSLIGIALNL